MDDLTLVKRAIEIIEDKKGEDVTVVDLSEVSIPTGFFVIAGADNPVHLRAIASAMMSDFPVKASRREGLAERRWVVLDYGDLVIHLFEKSAREFYDIEALWADHIVDPAILAAEPNGA